METEQESGLRSTEEHQSKIEEHPLKEQGKKKKSIKEEDDEDEELI